MRLAGTDFTTERAKHAEFSYALRAKRMES
jgi:hypothetical protein